jgi:hypothetical protein
MELLGGERLQIFLAQRQACAGSMAKALASRTCTLLFLGDTSFSSMSAANFSSDRVQ